MCSTFYFLHHCTLNHFLFVVHWVWNFRSCLFFFIFLFCLLLLLVSFILIYFLSVSLVWALLHTGGSSLRLRDLSHHDWVSSFDWWFTYLWDQMIHETYLHNLHMKRWDMGNYNDLEADYVIMFTFPWLGWITVQ